MASCEDARTFSVDEETPTDGEQSVLFSRMFLTYKNDNTGVVTSIPLYSVETGELSAWITNPQATPSAAVDALRTSIYRDCQYRTWQQIVAATPTTVVPTTVFDPLGTAAVIPAHPACAAPRSTSNTYEDVARKYCTRQWTLCVADTLLDLASNEGSRTLVHGISGGVLQSTTIQPRDNAASAALFEFAAIEGAYAIYTNYSDPAGINLGGTCPTCSMSFAPSAGAASTTLILSLGVEMARAIDIVREAVTSGAERYVSLAESLYATEGDRRVAIYQATLARKHAAGLVGGYVGDKSATRRVFGTPYERTPAVENALALIRLAGPDPLLLTGFPGSGLPMTTSDSDFTLWRVLGRAAARSGLVPPTTPAEADALLAQAGTSSAAMATARRILADEIELYSRSRVYATARELTAPNGTAITNALNTNLRRYAAVANPLSGESAWWIVRSRHITSNASDWYSAPIASSINVIDNWFQMSGTSTGVQRAVYDGATVIRNEFYASAPVRVDKAGTLTNPVVRFNSPVSSPGAVLLVPGHNTDGSKQQKFLDIVSCAVRGNIEGEPCTASVYTAFEMQRGAQDTSTGAFSWTYRTPSAVSPYVTGATNPTYAALVLKPGAVASPGAYEIIDLGQYTSGYVRRVMPDLIRRSGEYLLPDPIDFASAEVTCDAVGYNGLLPLENETTENGDDIENSWQHYLTLAAQAANEADMLGEASIEANATADEVAEGALSELEALCGVSLSLVELRSLVTTANTDPLAVIEAAGTDQSVPALRKLRECLSNAADVVRPFVSLGGREVCAWTTGGDPGTLCRTNDAASAARAAQIGCPSVVASPTDPCPSPWAGADASPYTTVRVTGSDLLGYFEPSEPPPGGRTTSCVSLRKVRAAIEATSPTATQLMSLADEWQTGLRHRRYTDPDTVARLAEGIVWKADPGNYSQLYFGGRDSISTGSFRSGGTAGIGCGSQGPDFAAECQWTNGSGATVTDTSSLFCRQNNCADPEPRAIFNNRLGVAAAMARYFGQKSYDGFVVPVMYAHEHASVIRGTGFVRTIPSPFSGGAPTRNVVVGDSGLGLVVCSERDTISNADIWRLNIDAYPGLDAVSDPEEHKFTWAFRPAENSTCAGWVTVFETLSGERRYGSREEVTDDVFTALQAKAREQLESLGTWQPEYTDNTTYANATTTLARAVRGIGISPPTHNMSAFASMFDPGVPWAPVSIEERNRRIAPIFDALELLCEADRVAGVEFDCENPPPILTLDDAASQLECVSRAVQRNSRVLFRDVPASAMDALRRSSGVGATVSVGGAFAADVIQVRDALIRSSRVSYDIDFHIRAAQRAFADAALQLRALNLENIDARAQTTAMIAGQTARCKASKPYIPSDYSYSSVVECADSLVQSAALSAAYANHGAVSETDEGRILLTLQDELEKRGQALNDVVTGALEDADDIDAALERIRLTRLKGQSALRRAFLMDTAGSGNVLRSQVAARQRMATDRVRYQRAFRNAVHLTHLAKRAIEQRFGLRLRDVDQDLAFVESPARWESRLCTMKGLDYERITDLTLGPDYADEYLGEYIKNLSNFVLSYAFDFPNTTGSDRAVISLRDDVLNVLDECTISVGNVLGHSNDFRPTNGDDDETWIVDGCDTATDPSVLENACVSVGPTLLPINWGRRGELGSPASQRVTFGVQDPRCAVASSPECPCANNTTNSTCGFRPEARLVQRVALAAGDYRLSWFARTVSTNGNGINVSGQDVVRVRITAGGAALPGTAYSDGGATPSGWTKYWNVFRLTRETGVDVEIRNPSMQFGAIVEIAGVQLERAPENAGSEARFGFIATDAPGERSARMCEDTDGDIFRRTAWRRSCSRLCPGGFDASCDVSQQAEYCYRELEFDITDSMIERGEIFGRSGFARGNYNYRIQSLAVNVVGTAARQCTDPTHPTTCYNAGWLPFSIEHVGPFVVRGHDGSSYVAPLFSGSIEHARALAAERYISNPVSGADEALLAQFERRELRGRPLTGRYLLRLWEEPGMSFDGVEDVQISLKYLYWTRNR